jgi:hypothetical protein
MAGSPLKFGALSFIWPHISLLDGQHEAPDIDQQAWFACVGMYIKANCPKDLFLFCFVVSSLFHSVCFLPLSRWNEILLIFLPRILCNDNSYSTNVYIYICCNCCGYICVYIYVINSSFRWGSHPNNVPRFGSNQNSRLNQCIAV